MPKKLIVPVLVALFLVAGGTSAYFYKQLSDLKKDPNQAAKKEAESLVAQVGKLVVLPEGETPTIATVTDPEKLKDQAFFKNAKEGDKVIIYINAKKAILYNPTTNKVVEISPLTIPAGTTPKASSSTPTTTGTTTETKTP